MKQSTVRNLLLAALVLGALGYLEWPSTPSPEAPRSTVLPDSLLPAPRQSGSHAGDASNAPEQPPVVPLDPAALLQAVGGSYLPKASPTDTLGAIADSLDHHLSDTNDLLQRLATAPEAKRDHFRQLLESKQVEFDVLQRAATESIGTRPAISQALRNQVSERFSRLNQAIDAVITAATAETRSSTIASAVALLSELRRPSPDRFNTPTPTFRSDDPPPLPHDAIPTAAPPAYLGTRRAEPASVGTATAANAAPALTGNDQQTPSLSILDLLGINTAHAAAPSAPLPACTKVWPN